tara:strand:+ start:1570 stop:2121 length:552 start_codon:yes stop_codon:yes gene_type:complete
MDFEKIERILWDNKDKIPQGDYIDLCEQIQIAHKKDDSKGGIRHGIFIEFNISIKIIPLTETDVSSDWENSEEDWENHEYADKPIYYEEEAIDDEYTIFLTEVMEEEDLGYIPTSELAAELRDTIHSSTKNHWWLYIDKEVTLDTLYNKIHIKKIELEEKKKLGLLEYRVEPLRIACKRIYPL